MVNIVIRIKIVRTEKEYLTHFQVGAGRRKRVGTIRMLGLSLDLKQWLGRFELIDQEGCYGAAILEPYLQKQNNEMGHCEFGGCHKSNVITREWARSGGKCAQKAWLQ